MENVRAIVFGIGIGFCIIGGIAFSSTDTYNMQTSETYKLEKVSAAADCYKINTDLMRKGIVIDENSISFACKKYSEQEAEKAYKKTQN